MIRKNLPQKEQEMIILKNFISNKSLNLKITSITESETPDFIVKNINQTISLELTQLIKKELREREVFLEKIVDNARDIFKAKYNSRLFVSVEFLNSKIILRGNQVNNICENLFKTVEEIYLKNREIEFDICVNGSKYIKKVCISNKVNFENWYILGAFKVPQIDANWVDEIITQKEDKIKNYSYAFDAKWLLLISNYGFKSDTYDFYNFHVKQSKSQFDKIYLYKYRDDEIIELK